ncbi:uncharacterized protein LOC132144279 [Carassius carassius]|uniref:uncharacterized protein LOC132144279 n=1 Tax=Carassius carassius TaxID=217509 RepID=UPI002868C5DF|nr:uncharacterized protein LOC132144279 [Carassius carassius]
MKILLTFFTFYLISDKLNVYKVSGFSGGRLMIKCEHPQYKTKPKYICKESDGCSERKSPGVQDEWMENGDVSLYDDTRAGVLMVFFRELKAADAGTYRCGVKESDYTERFIELQLSVKHDAKYPKRVTESVYLGEEVIITCQIPEKHKVHFCKEDDNHICQNISSSKVTEMSGSSERNEERVVTVSISNVSVRDAGVYWCGAETRDTDLTFISLNTQIQLNLISNAEFNNLLDSLDFTQHVNVPTHSRGHTLDLLITNSTSITNLSVHDLGVSDHKAITLELPTLFPISKPSRKICFRNLKNINPVTLTTDLCHLFAANPLSVTNSVDLYNSSLSSLLDRHAPVKSRNVTFTCSAPWYTKELRLQKRTGRVLERRFKDSGLAVHKLAGTSEGLQQVPR